MNRLFTVITFLDIVRKDFRAKGVYTGAVKEELEVWNDVLNRALMVRERELEPLLKDSMRAIRRRSRRSKILREFV